MFSSYPLLVIATFAFLADHSLVTSYEVPEKVYYNLDLSASLFDQYVSEYQKEYNTAEEAEYRFQVFKDNLQSINELNQKHESTVFGLTTFSDLTPEEFMATISCVHNVTDAEPAPVPNIEAPASLDFRQQNLVTEVKNQGLCGSCYIFGETADIEGQVAKLHQQLISLSEQYPLDCNPQFTCGGGPPEGVANWLAQTGGAVREQEYPYQGQKGKICRSAQPAVRVAGARRQAGGGTEAVKSILANHGPLATVFYASQQLHNYRGGVVNPSDCVNGQSNHAVALVGYGENHWIVKNSWGTQWGEQGYLRIAFEACQMGSFIFPSQVN